MIKADNNNNNNNNNSSNNTPPHIHSEWADLKLVGNGSLSEGVYKAKKLDGIVNGRAIDNDIIIKIIDRNKNHIVNDEIKCIETIPNQLYIHDYIIKFYGYGEAENKIYIYMEYLDGYQSIGALNKTFGCVNEIRKITYKLVSAINYLHQYKHVHRDIKCDNILYNQDSGDVKLIDFGLCVNAIDKKVFKVAGTLSHMAPEIKREIYCKSLVKNTKSDIWSLGCTLIEMIFGKIDTEISKEYIYNQISSSYPEDLKEFISLCLIVDPDARPSAQDLLNHSFLKSEVNRAIVKDETGFNDISYNQIRKQRLNSLLLLQEEEDDIGGHYSELIALRNHRTYIDPHFNDPITLNSFPQVSAIELSNFNIPIQPNSIHSSITSLTLPSYNNDLKLNSIPQSVTKLVLGESFQFNVYGGNLPDTILDFTCSYKFESPLKKNNNIPKKVKILALLNYNQRIITDSIPSTVHTLTLGSNYQDHFESLSNLPSSITNITFGVSKECSKSNEEIKSIISDAIKIKKESSTATTITNKATITIKR